jgi:hypothetical protein
MSDDFVTLICPPGAAISHGAVGYRAYLEDPRDPHSRCLVDLPGETTVQLAAMAASHYLIPRERHDELRAVFLGRRAAPARRGAIVRPVGLSPVPSSSVGRWRCGAAMSRLSRDKGLRAERGIVAAHAELGIAGEPSEKLRGTNFLGAAWPTGGRGPRRNVAPTEGARLGRAKNLLGAKGTWKPILGRRDA